MCRTSSQGTYAAQSRDPYSSNYSPTTVYIGGSSGAYTGATTAAAPRAGAFPPAAAPAPGPLVQLGPLGAAAAQNTSFGETQFTGVGPIYKKQDSLGPVSGLLPFCPSFRRLSRQRVDVQTPYGIISSGCSFHCL